MPLSEGTRQKALNAYDYKCAFCEMSEKEHQEQEGRSLDIHHIVPRRAGGSNDVENLIPVCRSCHRTLETTQGDALERLKKEELGKYELSQREREKEEKIEELREKVRELEGNMQFKSELIAEAQDEHSSTINAFENLVERNLSTTLYIVHQTRLTTSRLLYVGTSKESAVEAFEDSDNHATMETSTISIEEWVEKLPERTLEKAAKESELLPEWLWAKMVDNTDE